MWPVASPAPQAVCGVSGERILRKGTDIRRICRFSRSDRAAAAEALSAEWVLTG
jgi:hypothetical protein